MDGRYDGGRFGVNRASSTRIRYFTVTGSYVPHGSYAYVYTTRALLPKPSPSRRNIYSLI